jgi:hypothetical protein
MNSNFNYTGRASIQYVFNGRTVKTQHFNNGTDLLFNAYARALVGQSIFETLPAYLNIYYIEESEEPKSLFRSSKGASVVRTLATDENGKVVTRVSASITRDMLDIIQLTIAFASTKPLKLKLLTDVLSTTSNQETLAEIELVDNEEEMPKSNLLQMFRDTPSGIQSIIVWDLFITNNEKDMESDS